MRKKRAKTRHLVCEEDVRYYQLITELSIFVRACYNGSDLNFMFIINC